MPTTYTYDEALTKVKGLVSCGDKNLVEIAQSIITQYKLPYDIIQKSESSWELLKQKSRGEQWLDKFITEDPDTIEMKEKAYKSALTHYEVLIVGETGTGKEIIAKAQIGNREGPTKSINCAGIPRELIESLLFGHLKGSFTGADKEREGIIQAAKDGLVFMDEIGDLPLEQQAKLLRVLQDKKVIKVGSTIEEDVNCKFVFATNKNIKQMVIDRQFREDLYARISVLELDIKPLRERPCDVKAILYSMEGGKEFWDKRDFNQQLDLSLNVRSLQRSIIRWKVWGKI